MKLIDCLNQLPDDMVMIDLVEIDRNKKYKQVEELKRSVNPNESGYEVRELKKNYGRTIKTSIGIIGGGNLYIED